MGGLDCCRWGIEKLPLDSRLQALQWIQFLVILHTDTSDGYIEGPLGEQAKHGRAIAGGRLLSRFEPLQEEVAFEDKQARDAHRRAECNVPGDLLLACHRDLVEREEGCQGEA